MPEDPRLAHLTKICLALPEATRRLSGSHAAFLVRKKTFAYYLSDHHGDGIVAVTCKVAPGDNSLLVAAQPGRFYLPAYIGPKGWVALRLDIGDIDWDEVTELVSDSYRRIAPKRLAELGQNSVLISLRLKRMQCRRFIKRKKAMQNFVGTRKRRRDHLDTQEYLRNLRRGTRLERLGNQ